VLQAGYTEHPQLLLATQQHLEHVAVDGDGKEVPDPSPLPAVRMCEAGCGGVHATIQRAYAARSWLVNNSMLFPGLAAKRQG
jgi:hypothetical protein